MANDDDAEPKPRSDAYVGLLIITLLAVLAGAVLMHLDADEIETAGKGIQPPAVNADANGLAYAVAAAGQDPK